MEDDIPYSYGQRRDNQASWDDDEEQVNKQVCGEEAIESVYMQELPAPRTYSHDWLHVFTWGEQQSWIEHSLTF